MWLGHAMRWSVVLILVSVLGVDHVTARTRKYYIAAEEYDWHYTGGYTGNLLNIHDRNTPKINLERSFSRIGPVYKKALYFEYTDETFTKRAPKPKSHGLLGPLIRGEVGDTLEINFFNNASREYSIHPHGVFYLKNAEGAIYVDGTSGRDKYDDIVFPGTKIKLLWQVSETSAPGPNDPNCIPWPYHSHIDAVRDTSSGLIGVIVTCRPGFLDANNKRTDVDKDYPLLVKIFDENQSYYIKDNIKRCWHPESCRRIMDDGDFRESNFMGSINGYMYGFLPGLEACINKKVAFYVMGLGDDIDVHSLHFHGQDLHYKHTRGDTVSVYSATFVAAEMTPRVPGYWLLGDMTEQYEKRGIGAYLHTKDCIKSLLSLNPETFLRNILEYPALRHDGAVREYFLTAEKITWDYGPSGVDGRTGLPLTEPGTNSRDYFQRSSTQIGGVYYKAMFMQYTDSTFSTKLARGPDQEHMGLLGPVIRAEVGDTLKVTLRNNVNFPISFLPHGLLYSPKEEITGSIGRKVGGKIIPGQSYTYMFLVPDDLLEESTTPCRNFLYYSAYDYDRDTATGLVGPLVLCRKGYLSSNVPKPKEHFLFFNVFRENDSHYIEDTIEDFVPEDDQSEEGSEEGSEEQGSDSSEEEGGIDGGSNNMWSINGYSWGNVPGLSMCVGDDVTWYVMALGSEDQLYTPMFHGNTFIDMGKRRDVKRLVAGSTGVLNMNVDNPGRWMIESFGGEPREHGLFAFYEADLCGQVADPFVVTGRTREFYVAAEEIEWDYAPLERSITTGKDLNDPRDESEVFVRDDDEFIGDVYKKAVYREYTDPSFTIQKVRDQADQHLNLLGPAIRVEVGDLVRLTFRNKATRPYSLHVNGLRYTEANSGVNYHPDQAVAPGDTKVYTWEVPERSGPGPADPNCIPFVYESGVDTDKDWMTGLMGNLVVCRAGILDVNGRRRDVDRELFFMLSVIDESVSWYFEDNIQKYAPARVGAEEEESDEDWEDANEMNAINGRIQGNTKLVMEYNETVVWYFSSWGTEVHPIHLHGHTTLDISHGHRDDSINIFPGEAEAIEMKADNPGTWFIHCHMNEHILWGMKTVYTVLPPGEIIN